MSTSLIESRPTDTADKLDFLWLEITPKCNLNCVHCYAESTPLRPITDGLQLGDWKQVIEEAAHLGCRKLQFIGGEPTLHPDLSKLIDHAHANYFSMIEVYTNGTVLTDDLKECFVRNRVRLAFSVYGTSASVHESITQVAGSQGKTLAAVAWALRAGLQVRVGLIEMLANKDEIEPTRKMLEDLGVTQIGVDRARGIGRGRQQTGNDVAPLEQLCGRCAPNRLCITSSGDIFPCVFSRLWKIGSVQYGLNSALTSEELVEFATELRSVVTSARLRSVLAAGCTPGDPCQPYQKCEPDARCLPDEDCQPYDHDCVPIHANK